MNSLFIVVLVILGVNCGPPIQTTIYQSKLVREQDVTWHKSQYEEAIKQCEQMASRINTPGFNASAKCVYGERKVVQ